MESQDGVQEIVMGRASSPIVHQLKTGLVELLHLAEQLRRGGPPEAAAGCRVTRGRDKGPGRSGWRTHCQGAGQGAGQGESPVKHRSGQNGGSPLRFHIDCTVF